VKAKKIRESDRRAKTKLKHRRIREVKTMHDLNRKGIKPKELRRGGGTDLLWGPTKQKHWLAAIEKSGT